MTMSMIAYKGYVYESLNDKQLAFVHEKMQHAMEDFNAVLNTVQDGNQKKAMSSLMNKTIDTFNEKIKGVEYHPDNQPNQEMMSQELDAKLKDEQEKSADESNLESASSNEQFA